MFKRVGLLIATNLAVMLLLGVVLSVLQRYFGVNLGENSTLLLMAAIFGFGGAFVSLMISKWMAKRTTGMVILEQPRNEGERWLLDVVARQATAAGIKMPEVGIYDAPEINAFATGPSRNNSLVAVSSGLLRGMSRDEAEAVIGHEISHVANGDMITLALIQGVVNTFVIFLSRVLGHIVDRVVFKTERGHGPAFWITTIIAELVIGILASLIVFWFSRRREFRADAGGARLAGRERMIGALDRLRASYGREPLPDQMAAFGISGGVSHGLKRLFMTHPPLEERIALLKAE